MKKLIFGILIIALIITGGIFALAKKGGRDYSRNRDDFREKIFARVAEDLNLSDEQQTQARQVFEDSQSRIEPLMQQIEENRKQARELGTNGVYNEQKVQELADSQANLMKQSFIEKEKSKAQIFAILTPEQREQAKQKMNDFKNRLKKAPHRGFQGLKDSF